MAAAAAGASQGHSGLRGEEGVTSNKIKQRAAQLAFWTLLLGR